MSRVLDQRQLVKVWNAPTEGSFKVNADAADVGKEGCIGLDIVILDEEGCLSLFSLLLARF